MTWRLSNKGVAAYSSGQMSESYLALIREKSTDVVLLVWTILAVIALVLSLSRIPLNGFKYPMFIHLVSTATVLLTWLFRKNILAQVRMGVVVLAPLATGVVAISELSPAASAWLLTAVIIAGWVVDDDRIAWSIAATILILFTYIAFAPYVTNWGIHINSAESVTHVKFWLTGTVSMACLMVALLNLTGLLKKELMKLSDNLGAIQTFSALGTLSGGVAHEFNNQLGSVMGNLDILLESKDLNKKDRIHITKALSAAEKTAHATNSLLAFTSQQHLQPTYQNINSRIEKIGGLLANNMGDSIRSIYDLDKSPCYANVDGPKFDNVILILADNAKHAMKNGGKLTIKVRTIKSIQIHNAKNGAQLPKRQVEISVADTGLGIASEDCHKIFNPFYSSKPTGEGIGLGLSIVMGFVNQSGGEIHVESELNKGTIFRILLPCIDEPDK
jgi:signal transduction histidine kinase